jgi:hypothetical protein
MELIEKKMNLFEVEDKYYLTHCISADCELGAGIAVEFQKRFKLKQILKLEIGQYGGDYPQCILVDKVFNLVTKSKYWNKPTYESITTSIKLMKLQCERKGVKYLAMPKIGCGLDRLQWGKVREILQEEFKNTDIEILVCHI